MISPARFLFLSLFLLLSACTPAAMTVSPFTATIPPVKATIPATAPALSPAAPTSAPAGLTFREAALTAPAASPTAAVFPLADPGPYVVGKREYEFADENRGGRLVKIAIWYPAVLPADAGRGPEYIDAAPDMSGAPYPVILGSSKTAGGFARHLASHGFAMVGVRGQDAADRWGEWLIDYPLDDLFVLDQIAAAPIEGLDGVIDAEHAGVMGYSFDGYVALALSGARVDPDFYLARCDDPMAAEPVPEKWWIAYICAPAEDWDNFATHAGAALTHSNDGMWQPMTDERIKAVMPMGPEGAWLFGERGLAAADRPTLLIAGTNDALNYYDLEAVTLYERLGTPDRTLISFNDEGHFMIFNDDPIDKMQHFAAAFFGATLQGRSNLAGYYAEEFVDQYSDLTWGVYSEE